MDKRHLYTSCVTYAREDNRLVLAKPFSYKNITVPAGFVTNGANIPRVFWSLIPPFAPHLLPAVVIHDFLCAKERYALADVAFEEVLRVLEVAKWKRCVMVAAVTAYHRVKYGVRSKAFRKCFAKMP